MRIRICVEWIEKTMTTKTVVNLQRCFESNSKYVEWKNEQYRIAKEKNTLFNIINEWMERIE